MVFVFDWTDSSESFVFGLVQLFAIGKNCAPLAGAYCMQNPNVDRCYQTARSVKSKQPSALLVLVFDRTQIFVSKCCGLWWRYELDS
jgi:hypothetical protein